MFDLVVYTRVVMDRKRESTPVLRRRTVLMQRSAGTARAPDEAKFDRPRHGADSLALRSSGLIVGVGSCRDRSPDAVHCVGLSKIQRDLLAFACAQPNH